MVDNRFIEVLNGRDLITLFQPAHSVMQAGVGPIRKLARGFVREGAWVAQSKATRPCRYCTVFTPIRKAFMQGRHVGHGIISTGDLGLAGSRDCLTGSSEQGTDTPSSSPDIQVDRCQKSHEGIPNPSASSVATDACKAPRVEWEGHRALLVPKPCPKSPSHTAYGRMIPASL